MRKMPVILFGLLIATLTSMSTISPAQAYIERFTWQPPFVHRGYEYRFYDGERIVGYEHGTTVILTVPVENDWYSPNINVTSVSLVFDTGLNITPTISPVKIDYYESHFFDVNFTADVAETSNLWAHTYRIYVNYDHPYGTDTWTVYWDYWYPGYKFVVFSADQKESMDIEDEYYATETSWYNFESAEARSLAHQAQIEGSLGETYLGRWDFANAKTHFQTALDLFDDAFAAEEDWGTTSQEATLNATITEANAAMKEADAADTSANAAMNQSYALILLGLGTILIGIGAIIYAVKKPKAA